MDPEPIPTAPSSTVPSSTVPSSAMPPSTVPPPVPPPAPPVESPPPRPAPSRPATDPVVAVAGNATMLGLGYMFMRRPILAALALSGTGFLLWSAAVQTENPLWRYLLPAWGLVMIVHAWWLTRRTRVERLVGEDPARRPRFFAVTAAALVLLTVAWFRLDAWWIAHDAESAHEAGDCVEANAAIDEFDAVHRVAFGPAVLRGEEEHEACDLLLAALEESPTDAAATMATYLEHPGALWDGAGPKRAEFLFEAALLDGEPNLATVERGFTQLTDTLEAHPDQADTVETTVTAFMDDLAKAPSPCTGHAVDDWLARKTWDSEAISAPIKAAAGQIPDRLLDCALERTETRDGDAATLFREFLTTYPDHERAGEAADGVLASGTYCADPVAYPAAPDAGGPGPHPMQLVGAYPAAGRGFPDSWLAATAAETALVVCVEAEVGEFQDSCQYRRPDGSTFWASFSAHRFTIAAYSLKTGELVDEYAREIGDPCPNRLDGTFETISFYVSDSFMSMASEYTDEDFRNMFTRLQD